MQIAISKSTCINSQSEVTDLEFIWKIEQLAKEKSTTNTTLNQQTPSL